METGQEPPATAPMRARLQQWRREHPQATFDEIEDAVQHELVQLQAQLVAEVMGTRPADAEPATVAGEEEAEAAEAEEEAEAPACPTCGGPMQRSGRRTRSVLSRLGQPIVLERAYYVCPACGAGLFPPG